MRVIKEYIQSGPKIIRFMLINILILFFFGVLLMLTGGIGVKGEFGFDETMFWGFYFILSTPLFLIGFFTEKEAARRVGLAYPFAYMTMLFSYEIMGKHFPPPPFFYKEPNIYFKILSTFYVAYLGTLFTGAGAVIGERIRPKIHEEHVKMNLQKGFLVTYIFSTLLQIWWFKLF